MLRIPHCLYSRLTDGGTFLSLTQQPHFTPQKHYYFYVSTYPEVSVLEVTAVVLDYPGTVTLLHNGDFLDDLLEIRVHRNLLDGQDLPRLLV
jgi:hypothetical protein